MYKFFRKFVEKAREKLEDTNAILGENGKATNPYVKITIIKKTQLNHIQRLTPVLPQHFKSESLTSHTMFVLTHARRFLLK